MKDYYPGLEDSADEIKTDSYHIGDVSASTNLIIFDAPSDVQITKIKLTVDTAIDISTDNYYSIQAVNQTQNDNLLATADNYNYDTAITAYGQYEITPDQNSYLRDGDVLELQLTLTGTLTLSGLYVEVEYVVTGFEATTTSTSTTTTTTTTSSSTSSSTSSTTSTSTTTTSSSTSTTTT